MIEMSFSGIILSPEIVTIVSSLESDQISTEKVRMVESNPRVYARMEMPASRGRDISHNNLIGDIWIHGD
jgi:hypothetical protein